MAYFDALGDGSYAVDVNGRRIRTALDPSEFEGYEARPPEVVAPEQLSAEDRLARIAESIDLARRENDPDYRAFAEQKDREKAFVEQEQKTRALERQLQEDKARQPYLAQNTPEIPDGQSAADFQQGGFAQARAPLPAAEGKSKVTVPPKRVEQVNRAGAPINAPGEGGRDPELASVMRSRIFRRSGASPGGWSPTTTTTQREGVPTPEALAGVERAAQETEARSAEAIDRRADALDKHVVRPALDRLESDAMSLRASYDQRKATDEELAKLKTHWQKKEQAAEQMERIDARSDYWANKGAFARVLAGVTAGLFQLGQGLAQSSGPNIVHEMHESAIAENAERLRQEHEDAIADGRNAKNAYSEALATYGTREDAMKALRLEGQALADRVQTIQMQRFGMDEEKANHAVAMAQRKEARAREWADLSAKAAGTTVSASRYSPPQGPSVSMDPKALDAYLKLTEGGGGETQLRQREAENHRRVWLPREVQQKLGLKSRDAYAADPEAAKQARDTMDVYVKGLDAINDLESVYGTPAHELNTDLKNRIEANAGVIQQLVGNKALRMSQQTEGEFERVTDALRGDQGTKWLMTDSQALESLRKARELFLQDADHHLRGMTASPWQQDYIVPEVQ